MLPAPVEGITSGVMKASVRLPILLLLLTGVASATNVPSASSYSPTPARSVSALLDSVVGTGLDAGHDDCRVDLLNRDTKEGVSCDVNTGRYVLLDGFWVNASTSAIGLATAVFPCKWADSCVATAGGGPPFVACAEPYTGNNGTVPLCGGCRRRHYRSAQACEACPTDSKAFVVALGVGCYVGLLVLAVRNTGNAGRGSRKEAFIRIVLSFYALICEIISSLSSLSHLGADNMFALFMGPS